VTARSPRPRVLAEGKRARAAAPRRAAQVAPSAMLRLRSGIDLCGVLGELAHLHARLGEVLGVLHEVGASIDSAQESRVPLEDPPERALMGPVETTTGIGLRDIASDYLDDLEVRVSPRHFVQVRARLGKVLDTIGDMPAADLKPLNVIRFRNDLRRTGVSDRTVDTHTGPLKTMLTWGVEVGLITENPLAKLKKLSSRRSEKRHKRRAMTDEEIARFLSAARIDDEDNDARAATEGIDRVPQVPLWTFLLDSGARWGEARQLAWRDVDFDQRAVVLRSETTKSRRQRAIPMTASLESQLRTLDALREDHPGVESVFLSPEGRPWGVPTTNPMRIYRRIMFRAGIERETSAGKLDLHSLRVTFASRLARCDAGLVKVQRLLGHSHPSLTEAIYSRLTIDDLRDAVEAMG